MHLCGSIKRCDKNTFYTGKKWDGDGARIAFNSILFSFHFSLYLLIAQCVLWNFHCIWEIVYVNVRECNFARKWIDFRFVRRKLEDWFTTETINFLKITNHWKPHCEVQRGKGKTTTTKLQKKIVLYQQHSPLPFTPLQ